MKFLALFVLTVGTYVVSADDHISWKYEGALGPDFWKDLKVGKNQCGMEAQSPIDIVTQTAKYDASMKILNVNNKDTPTPGITIVNTGHSIQLNSPNYTQTVSGGPLTGEYKLLQMHFHWGKDDFRGSEHTVNGKRWPLELHMVHANAQGQLAVIGIFFYASKNSSAPGLSAITKAIENMKTHGNIDIPSLAPGKLLPNTKDFFTYQGSLTTPPCSEIVTWIVLKDELPASMEDLAAFRSTKFEDDTNMLDNFRPVQALNNRPVRASFVTAAANRDSASTSMLTSLPLMILSAILCNY